MVTEALAPNRGVVIRGAYQCQCGHVLRVIGGGRHAIFFEPGDAGLEDPIMNRVCPNCGRGLPGKGDAYA